LNWSSLAIASVIELQGYLLASLHKSTLANPAKERTRELVNKLDEIIWCM
jgi:hypothetical protein